MSRVKVASIESSRKSISPKIVPMEKSLFVIQDAH